MEHESDILSIIIIIDNASNEQTIMSYLTNDAKLTAQIGAANTAKSYACCKTGSN